MTIPLLTKGMISSSDIVIRNLGNLGEISVDILYDEYKITIED